MNSVKAYEYKYMRSVLRVLLLQLCLVLLLTACSVPGDHDTEGISSEEELSSAEREEKLKDPENDSKEIGSIETGLIADEKDDVLEEQVMRIKVTDGMHTVIFELNDTPSAKSLYEMLPIDAAVENYSTNEKIFYPDEEINTAGGLEGDCKAGTLALFSPWGNVVMYYGSAHSYPGLYILGEAVEGTEQIRNLSGNIHVEKPED